MNRSRATALGAGVLAVAMLALLWAAWTMGPSVTPAEVPETVVAADDAALLGRVLDPEGQGVAGAEVVATPAEGEPIRVRSGADGSFAFGALASGRWSIDASAEGMLNPGPADKRVMKVVIDDLTALELDLQLRRPAQVSGRVMRGDAPVQGARVVAEVGFAESLAGPVRNFVVEVGVSAADGSFAGSVPPGRLQLVATPAERGGQGRAESGELVLADGGGRDAIRLDLDALRKLARLQGTVRTKDGQPLQASVELFGEGGPHTANSDAAGRYQLRDLPPGAFRMRVRAQGFGAYEADVTLRAGETTVRDVGLQGGGGLKGRVVDKDGNGVGGATLLLVRGDEQHQSRTGPDGRFQIDRPEQLGRGATLQALSVMHADSEVVEAMHGAEVELLLGPGGMIRGEVQDSDGKPLPGSIVSVVGWAPVQPDPFSPHLIRPDRVVNAEARFSLGPLRPGRYRLRAEAPGRGAVFVEDLVLSSGGELTGVVLRLGRGGVVRGQVRNEAGEPVPRARVMLVEAGSILPPKSARSDLEGRYEIKGVTPGRHSLRAQHESYLPVMESGVEVADGGEQERDLVLPERREGERFSFQGIGATLGQQGGAIVVRNLMADAPARIAGLQEGDRIVGVDGSTTMGMALSTVVERIRGEPGSTVMLDIDRPGQGRVVLSIQRGQVVVK